MSKSSDTIRSLLHRLGVVGPARARASKGSGALAALLLALGALAFTASPAFAKEIHLYSSSFGSTGSGNGQFKEPAGVAVNDSTSLVNPVAGDVYVVDKGNNRVERFSSAGVYEGQFNGSGAYEDVEELVKVKTGAAAPTGAFSKPEWIAVDNDESSPSFGDVYVTDNGKKVIDKFSATGEYLGQITSAVCPEAITPHTVGGQYEELELREYTKQREKELADCPPGSDAPFSELDGVAVDSAGELWVYQSNDNVDNYSDKEPNEFIASRPMQPWFNYLLQGFSPAPGFSLGPEDDLYVSYSDPSSKGDFFLLFDSAGDNSGQSEHETGFGGSATTAAAFDPANNDVYVDYGATVGAFDALTGTLFDAFGSEQLSASAGIAVNSSEGTPSSSSVYATDAAANHVIIFDASEVADTITEPASPVEKNEATLHGTVNPEGIEVTSCEFEYGTKPGVFTTTEKCSTPPGNGILPVPEEATLKGLLAGTTYYYRLTAANANGIPGSSSEEHFATPPAVDALSTGPAEEETPNTAKLTGSLSPNGTDAHYYFQYGTSTNYGHVSPARPGTDAGTVSVAVHAETAIAGLTAGTVYHFRLVGVNEFGTTYGPDVEFETPVAVEAVSTGAAEEVTGNAAKLTGSLSPDGTDAHYYFEYGTEAGIYSATAPAEPGVDAGQGGAGCVAPGGPPNCSSVAASTTVSGLEGGALYHYRIVAVNEFGTTYGPDKTFTTDPTPVVAGGEAVGVTGSGAELRATVNPEGVAIRSCIFEYGTSTSYETTAYCEQTKKQIGKGTEPVPVSLALSGLEANKEYHWRLVVTDKNGSSLGSAGSGDHTFVYPTTGPNGVGGLPDNRAYEMVTPPFKNGGLIGDVFFGFPADISESGSRVIGLDIQCFEPAESCNADRQANGEPFEFTRTPGGWQTTALAPPATQFGENTPWKIDADEGTALFSMPTGPAGEDEWYARSSDGLFSALGPATPPGETGARSGSEDKDATASFSHLIWETAGAHWPFDKTTGTHSLYEYVGTHNPEPFLVGVTGKQYSTELISACETVLGSKRGTAPDPWNALSADGRTVYFAAAPCAGGSGLANEHTKVPVEELYARIDGEEPDAHTVAISQPRAPQTLATTPPDENCSTEDEECQKDITEPANWRTAGFAGASVDGSMAFFLDPQQLTDGATEGAGSGYNEDCSSSGNECNLYLYDFNQPAGHNLIDVSEGPSGAPVPGGPRVQGVVAISADGSHVYFAANGVLANGARPGNCGGGDNGSASGVCNLYVYERDVRYPEGHIGFIEPLVNASNYKNKNAWNPEFTFANVTPDGRFLVFESGEQAFRYDAETEELVRISIGEDGFDDNGNGGTGSANIVPAFQAQEHAGSPRGDPTMSNDGAYVFFDSPRALTPHALPDVVIGHNPIEVPAGSNKFVDDGAPYYAQNVYEWHEGHVYLISDGHDAASAETPTCDQRAAVCLLGTDATGHNVFFTTADQLVPKDTDTQVDIYDARICEPASGNPCITEPSPPLPPCNEEACHGNPAATPSLLAPGTASFNGEGNIAPSPPTVVKPKSLTKAQKLANALKACKKKPKKQRATCEKQARSKYGAKRAKKSAKANRRSK